jgi:hypothetical protein
MNCPYCDQEIEKPQDDPEKWIVIYEQVANEFQGYTKQCNESVTATSCPNCKKGFMIKDG